MKGNPSHDLKRIKGIGPKKTQLLKRLGIGTLEDLLQHYPREYEDRRNTRRIADLVDGEEAMVRGMVTLILKGRTYGGRKQTLRLLVEDESGSLEVVFFYASYVEKKIQKGILYAFFGKVKLNQGRLQLVQPDLSLWQEGTSAAGILPIYPLTAGLTQTDMRKWMRAALNEATPQEMLPAETLLRNRLCDIRYATEQIHFPEDGQKVKEARFRLVFEELLTLQTGLLSFRNRLESEEKGYVFSGQVKMQELIAQLPFSLTEAQQKVLAELETDMESSRRMHRLVQGDVGSGKTVVAAAALYKAAKCGYQGVMMAPTELLAKQHYQTLSHLLAPFQISIGFLTSSVVGGQRKKVLAGLQDGTIQVLVGTHAVIQSALEFQELSIVITDEQHRFGVEQRKELSRKGRDPEVLVMTATPIPRTLAMILYGDLDISVIDQLPPGRIPIKTRSLEERERSLAYHMMKRELDLGHQAYIVAPLIRDGEGIDARSAESIYVEVKETMPVYETALLHGSLSQKEKDQIMEAFVQGRTQILVSTVVIEVGIDVPNATIMLIENAERFGLAQLHQLRGRVGRGKDQSYCILISKETSELAKKRATMMEQTNDGFLIAEQDLIMRGTGEFFGTRQHGIPEFRIADLTRHQSLLPAVRKEADLLLAEDPALSHPKHLAFHKKISHFFDRNDQIGL